MQTRNELSVSLIRICYSMIGRSLSAKSAYLGTQTMDRFSIAPGVLQYSQVKHIFGKIEPWLAKNRLISPLKT